jgi:membrane fusion protein, copper/silver efflux system
MHRYAIPNGTYRFANPKFEGRVFYVLDEVDRKARSVLARIEVPNPGHLLKPGMFAHTLIEASDSSREVPIVPESAVCDYQDDKVVFVAAGPSRYETRSVDVGGRSEDNVEIVAGMSEGQQVVITGGLALKVY